MSTVADSLPLLACFFYSALFATVRDLLRRFRTTNPMWLKSPDSYRHRIATAWGTLSDVFLERVRYLADRLSLARELTSSNGAQFQTASAMCLPFPTGLFGAVLTSPPYATRIDYVRGTLPELAVLGADDAFLSALRKETTGSPVVAGSTGNQAEPLASESRVPGSGVRGRGSGERETTASSLAGKEESSRKEDNSGQGKDGPAGAIAQGGNGR